MSAATGGAYFDCFDALERLDNQLNHQAATPDLTIRALIAIGHGLLAVAEELETFNRTRGMT